MKDPVTKRSRGFGFVTFTDVAAVDNALANEPHTIDSRKVITPVFCRPHRVPSASSMLLLLLICSCHQVEAKRAVPRSEINRENGGQPPQKSNQHAAPHNAAQGQSSGSQKSSAPSGAGNASAKSAAPAAQARKESAAAENKTGAEQKINLDDYAFNKIFVGGLHYDTRDGKGSPSSSLRTTCCSSFLLCYYYCAAEFRAYFEKYGKVISAEVMFNRETHKSRGFGFIVFETESSAVQVCTVKEHTIDGKVVEVKRAIPRSRLTPGTPSAQISPSMYTMANLKSAAAPSANRPAAAAAQASGGQQKSPTGPAAAQTKATAKSEESTAAAETAKGGAAPVTPSSRPVTTSTSYAAALKVGTAYESAPNAGAGPAGMLANRDHAAPHLSNSGMNLMFSRMQQSMAQNAAIQRPSRSYSEPMVATGIKFEGSSSLNGDVMDEALLLNRGSAGAITKTPSSNASSRSNSIVQAPSFLNGSGTPTLANIPWLSSPPSNPLDPTGVELGLQLPPAIEQKPVAAAGTNQSNVPYAVQQQQQQQQQNGPPGIVNNSGLWFPVPQQQQQASASDAAQAQAQQQQQQQQQAFQAAMQQQYLGGPFGGMMFMPGPYMGLQPPPGVAPTPDVWAAMVSSHAMHEQMGLPPGQYPGQPFMMPQFPFFSPEAGAMAFGPGATPQQQMLFFNAQQQMQAMQMQHMQYQAQAMAAQQAQLQQQARNQPQGSQGSTHQHGSQQGHAGQNNSEQKTLGGSFIGGDSFGKTGAPGLSPTTGTTTASTTQPTSKSSEHTESDDLFNLHGLNLDSPAFVPSGQASWMPDVRR